MQYRAANNIGVTTSLTYTMHLRKLKITWQLAEFRQQEVRTDLSTTQRLTSRKATSASTTILHKAPHSNEPSCPQFGVHFRHDLRRHGFSSWQQGTTAAFHPPHLIQKKRSASEDRQHSHGDVGLPAEVLNRLWLDRGASPTRTHAQRPSVVGHRAHETAKPAYVGSDPFFAFDSISSTSS